MIDRSGEITRQLQAHARGDADAYGRLIQLVYQDLRRVAHRQLRRRGSRLSLDTTDLVHEAYLKLADQARAAWNDRSHFFAVAARAMRHLIVDHAKHKLRAKRGGGRPHVPLDGEPIRVEQHVERLLAVDEGLRMLGTVNERLVKLVECRFFAGLTEEETAETLGVSVRTVQRDWVRARTWLKVAMNRQGAVSR